LVSIHYSIHHATTFSWSKNQGPFILNEAMPDLMVAFLGWNSNFEKKVRGA